jgi:hypothetical protein
MSRVRAVCSIVFGLTALHASAHAEEDGPQPVNTSASLSAGADEDIGHRGYTTRSSDKVQEHPAGTYTGVAPGAAATPAVQVPAGKSPATITWPGFQMRPDGTSRVFIQSTAPLDAQPSAAPGKYLVQLPGARVSAGTNRLPLETRFFNTPVTRVSISANHAGAQLILDLRADVAPQLSSERGPTGYYFTFIDLPKGHYVASPDKSDKAKLDVAGAPATSAMAAPNARVVGPSDLTTDLDATSGAHADASAHAGISSMDHELPPSIKAHTRASGSVKLGK